MFWSFLSVWASLNLSFTLFLLWLILSAFPLLYFFVPLVYFPDDGKVSACGLLFGGYDSPGDGWLMVLKAVLMLLVAYAMVLRSSFLDAFSFSGFSFSIQSSSNLVSTFCIQASLTSWFCISSSSSLFVSPNTLYASSTYSAYFSLRTSTCLHVDLAFSRTFRWFPIFSTVFWGGFVSIIFPFNCRKIAVPLYIWVSEDILETDTIKRTSSSRHFVVQAHLIPVRWADPFLALVWQQWRAHQPWEGLPSLGPSFFLLLS